jgi:predicted MFS family arabinose efflux permease
VLAIWETTCTSMMVVATIALCMDVSSPKVGATQFTSYMALSNLSTTLGYKLGGYATEALSYVQLYVIAGIVQIAITLLLVAVDPKEARSKLPLPAGWTVGPYAILTAAVFVIAVLAVPIILIL